MTDTEIIIEVAKLDGWKYPKDEEANDWTWISNEDTKRHDCLLGQLKCYLTSRDAIIPVIEKQLTDDPMVEDRFLTKFNAAVRSLKPNNKQMMLSIFLTPRQLCIALLKATGRWKE